jgi:zinc/manganese transport system permease protein
MSKAAGEAEHLRDMLVGNILSVQWPEVWWTAAIYLVIGVFHWVFRKRFLEISMDPHAVAARGVSVRFWDFLFYASFGFVVTRSVAIAGVLLVFCYLIVPSVGAMLWAARIGPRLAIGWAMGTLVSVLGMYFSVLWDLPTGATIVCTFGVVLTAMAVVRPLVVRILLGPGSPGPAMGPAKAGPYIYGEPAKIASCEVTPELTSTPRPLPSWP